jgi:hypothetical protein
MITYIVLGVIGYLFIGVTTTTVLSYFQKSNRFVDFPSLIIVWPLCVLAALFEEVCQLYRYAAKGCIKAGDKMVALKRRQEEKKEEIEMKKRTKRLTVMVAGFAGSGKTTLARKIEELLVEEGISVDRIPDDDEECDWSGESCKKKLKALIDGGFEVVVKSVQLRRPMPIKSNKENEQEDLEADVQTEMSKINEIEENSELL